jgi:hypothetical protein
MGSLFGAMLYKVVQGVEHYAEKTQTNAENKTNAEKEKAEEENETDAGEAPNNVQGRYPTEWNPQESEMV